MFFLVLCQLMPAQVLLPTAETAFEEKHNFNPRVIRDRKIRAITFEIIDKKDFQVAVDKSLTEIYEFDPDGNLTRHYYTRVLKEIEKQVTRTGKKGRPVVQSRREFLYDTISTSYFYQDGRLVLRRYHDGASYYESRYYRYDAEGRLTKELRYRETNNSPNKSSFILGNQVLMSEDSFQYNRFSSGQLKCVLLNNEYRPYKEVIINFDSLGRRKTVTESYTAASWIRQNQAFKYDGPRLVEATFEGNAGNKVSLRNTYEYDTLQELYTEKQYRNEQLRRELSYVTSREDALLNSIVIRDTEEKTIRIIRLRYVYWK